MPNNVKYALTVVFQMKDQFKYLIANALLEHMDLIQDKEHVFSVILINGLVLVPLHVLVARIIVLL